MVVVVIKYILIVMQRRQAFIERRRARIAQQRFVQTVA